MGPDHTFPGTDGPEHTGPGTNGPEHTGPRTNRPRKNWSGNQWAQKKLVQEQMGPRTHWSRNQWVHNKLVQEPMTHNTLVQEPMAQNTLVQEPMGHNTLVQGHTRIGDSLGLGHEARDTSRQISYTPILFMNSQQTQEQISSKRCW